MLTVEKFRVTVLRRLRRSFDELRKKKKKFEETLERGVWVSIVMLDIGH